MAKIPILSARKISKYYGGIQALDEVDFDCYKGEIHALIGENGAGKSTLVKILCGVVLPDSGNIFFKGEAVNLLSPSGAAKFGIASVFQELSLVPDLSVAENVYLGNEPLTKFGLIDFRQMDGLTKQVMKDLEFDIDTSTLVKNLPFADQQLVEIAKVLSKDPEIVLMDEATSSLGTREVEKLFKIIKKITRDQKKTVIFISHKMGELEQIADIATIFRDAQHICTFKWGKHNNHEIINLIAGRKIESAFPQKKQVITDDIALEVCGISVANKLEDISLKIRRGEIIGLGGLVGHGQTEFLDILFGAKHPDQGLIKIHGKPVSIKNPGKAIKLHISLTPADRKKDGLLLSRSIKENLTLMTLKLRSNFGLINRKKENQDVAKMIQMLKIKASNSDQITGTLSGGNQQKTVIGKAILTNSDILLLSDPTRGIDVGTKFELYQLIRKLADKGNTIVFYSTENNELLGLCDRIVVFKQGRITTVLEGAKLTEREILKSAMGIKSEEVPL